MRLSGLRRGVAVKLLAIATLGACTNVQVGDGGMRKTYIGFVSINAPQAPDGLQIVEAENFGVGWEKGPFLGWSSDSWITADPEKCQMVIVIRSDVEVSNTLKILKSLEGQDICVADLSGSLGQ